MNKNLSDSLNKYVSNSGILFVKLHNLHWNVYGLSFKAVHEYLEELYDFFSDVLDASAEVLKMFNEYPSANLNDFLKNGSIKELESNKSFSCKDALKIVLDDLEQIRKDAFLIVDLADENKNFKVSDLIHEHIGNYDKQIWFIKSMLQKE